MKVAVLLGGLRPLHLLRKSQGHRAHRVCTQFHTHRISKPFDQQKKKMYDFTSMQHIKSCLSAPTGALLVMMRHSTEYQTF